MNDYWELERSEIRVVSMVCKRIRVAGCSFSRVRCMNPHKAYCLDRSVCSKLQEQTAQSVLQLAGVWAWTWVGRLACWSDVGYSSDAGC